MASPNLAPALQNAPYFNGSGEYRVKKFVVLVLILPALVLGVGSDFNVQWSTAQADNNSGGNPLELAQMIQDIHDGKVGVDLEALRYLGRYHVAEVMDVFLGVLEIEVFEAEKRGIQGQFDPAIVEFILKFLHDKATVQYAAEYQSLTAKLKNSIGNTPVYRERFSPWIIATLKIIHKKKQRPPTIEEILNADAPQVKALLPAPVNSSPGLRQALSDPQTAREYLSRFEQHLLENYKGQPEAVSSFTDLVRRALMYFGQREKPTLRLLMGMPGTGKDTGVRAFVDALHQRKGAWKDHMFSVPVARTEADAWKIFGSNTGYKGSDNFPPILSFLVRHSAGRYVINERKSPGGSTEYFVTENPNWRPGQIFEGYSAPEEGVIYVNEFHNWSKSNKDILLKEPLEYGQFIINNPNGGLSRIEVPINMMMATNEGISLVTSREANGQRFGDPLSYEEIMAKWEATHLDTAALRNQLWRTNGQVNDSGSGGDAPGISEEVLNRIPDSAFLLLRPHSPQTLQDITRIKLSELRQRLSNPNSPFGTLEFTWSDELVDYIQNYNYIAEDNARPIEDRVSQIVENTLQDAVAEQNLPDGLTEPLSLDIHQNEDGTASLRIEFADPHTGEVREFLQMIRITEAQRQREPLSPERIQALLELERQLNERVFGIEHITRRLAEVILSSEVEINGRLDESNARTPAHLMAFFGKTSTAKTRTAQELGRLLYRGDTSKTVSIDFSSVTSIEDLKIRILGTRDARGNPIASDFMKHYDRNQGKLLFIFDEIANAHPAILKALYDIFREPVVRTFSDGKARIMSGVRIILTGNAGEEWYESIPSDVPDEVMMSSMREVYLRAVNSPSLQRTTLQKYFSDALLARIGEENIFFVPPLFFKPLRQLTQLKLMELIRDLAAKEGVNGWNLAFYSPQDFLQLVEWVEDQGFVVKEQGASIDRYVSRQLKKLIRTELLRAGVPSGATVALQLDEESRQVISIGEQRRHSIELVATTAQGQSIRIPLPGKQALPRLEKSSVDEVLTAVHEVGHEIARAALFGDLLEPVRISIRPGVADIGGQMIYYAGVAEGEYNRRFANTREVVVREIASLLAGYLAQTLATTEGHHDSGKRNDIQRATQMARSSILALGLSEEWGDEALQPKESLNEYLQGLSEEKRRRYEAEVEKLLQEGREMALAVLQANRDHILFPLAARLAEVGELKGREILEYYEQHPVITYEQIGNQHGILQGLRRWWDRLSSSQARDRQSRDAVLVADFPLPATLVDIEELIREERRVAVSDVELPEGLPLVDQGNSETCRSLLSFSRETPTN